MENHHYPYAVMERKFPIAADAFYVFIIFPEMEKKQTIGRKSN